MDSLNWFLMKSLDLADFLATPGIILDVRSPAEHAQGHIPGSLNLPLFDNRERALIGTLYKREGPDRAFNLGLELVGPKLTHLVNFAKQHHHEGVVKVHCWRGGMRSSSLASLLEIASIPSVTLRQGYKNYRRYALQLLQQPRTLIVLGGLTGVGKTILLQHLKELGEQVLDLEGIACHRGSSYGWLSNTSQPTTEQFENEIAQQWASFDPSHPIWIEDESRMIGCCKIPDSLFHLLNTQPLIVIEKPLSERVVYLKEDYGQRPVEELIQATERLHKKLGGSRTKEIILLIQEKQLNEAIVKVLSYYDTAYFHSLSRRHQLQHPIYLENTSHRDWALHLLILSKKLAEC